MNTLKLKLIECALEAHIYYITLYSAETLYTAEISYCIHYSNGAVFTVTLKIWSLSKNSKHLKKERNSVLQTFDCPVCPYPLWKYALGKSETTQWNEIQPKVGNSFFFSLHTGT